MELARYGIRANAILPGWVETAMTEAAFQDSKFEEKVLTRVPVRRWGVPADFGGIAVLFGKQCQRVSYGRYLPDRRRLCHFLAERMSAGTTCVINGPDGKSDHLE